MVAVTDGARNNFTYFLFIFLLLTLLYIFICSSIWNICISDFG